MRRRAVILALWVLGCEPKKPAHAPAQGAVGQSPAPPTLQWPAGSQELRAVGNEPFWSVSITPEAITYRDPERLGGIPFPYAEPSTVDSLLVFSVERPHSTPRQIRVALRERECNDGMSERRYRYSAEVTLDGRRLSGCADYWPFAGSRP